MDVRPKKWLKMLVFTAFSSLTIFTGTLNTQAEEVNSPSTEVSSTEMVNHEESVTDNQEDVQIAEISSGVEESKELSSTGESLSVNSQQSLDQTIGESQHAADSPEQMEEELVSQEQEISVEPAMNEETQNVSSQENSEPTKPNSTENPESSTASVQSETGNLQKSEETDSTMSENIKTVVNESVVEKDNAVSEEEEIIQEENKTTIEKKNTTLKLASNNIVTVEYVGQGINWATVIDPGRGHYTFDAIPMFKANGQVAFCIEPGVDFKGAGQVHSLEALSTYLSDATKRHRITLISYYGYINNSDKSKEQYFTTQLMIGEVLGRTILGTYSGLDYENRKLSIQKLVNDFDKRVSFNNETKTVEIGQTIRITDTNNVLKDIVRIIPSDGIIARIEGNQLVITVTKDAPENATISLSKLKAMSSPLVYKKSGSQTIGVLNPIEPNSSILRLNVLKQGNFEIVKIDANTKEPLANAEFKVTMNGKDQIVKTDENGKATIKDILHGTTGTVVEVTAPTGYVINNVSKSFTIQANQTITFTFDNKEQLGIARIIKEDAETGNQAQGAATLENAVYGLYQADGTKIKSVTLKNINGRVQAEITDLKLADYYWLEEQAPVGYNLNTNKIYFSLIYGDQTQETVTKEVIATDQVIKGTIEGVKVGNKDFVDTKNPDNKPKLAGIEISLTSKTTGKVVKSVLTDKDGYFTFGQNATVFDTYIVSETKGKEGYKLFEPFEVTISEQGQTFRYVLEDQIIEQQVKIVKVDGDTGEVIPLANTEFKIFDTLANQYITMPIPNDTEITDIFRTNDKGFLVTNGTLTYGIDRYWIEEVNAPLNYVLNKTPLVLSITDDTEPIKVIQFGDPKARKNVKLVKYEEWNKKKTPLVGVTFTLYNGEGKALGEYTTDTNGELLVKGLVAGAYYFVEKAPLESFQPNTDKQAFTVAFKQNAPDDGETLLVSVRNYLIPPTMETQASNKEDGEKVVDPLETIVIKDSVSYTNLFVGKEYTISGVLMNKATNAPILQGGKEIRKTLTFIADKANGTKDLEFVVNASVLKGQTIVVFEKLFRDGIEVAAHEDITDENQSVRVNNPTVHTTAVFEDGLTVADPTGLFTLNDTVEITEILPGKAYLVKGILMDKATGEPLIVHGNTVETSVGFIAKAENETVIVPFTFDLTDLNGREIVVFESLFRNDEELANHKDINDKGQTVRITNPAIGTKATDKETGLQVIDPLAVVTITDAVAYHDLIVGKTYIVNGILMDKATEQPVLVDDKEITSTLTFVAETTDGTVNLDFVLDARALRGKEVVVFEDLFRDGALLASHADITDEGQTVRVTNPSVRTTATHKTTGLKVVNPLTKVTITDAVSYHDLIIGRTYTVNGILMDKATEQSVLVDGKEVTSTLTFVAESTDGTVYLDFVVDARTLRGKEVVVFEDLLRDDVLLASHADITDEDQTIKIVNPTITTKATNENGGKEILALPNQKVKEWVQLNDLAIGQWYKLIVQGYLTPDGTPFEGTHAEKIFVADKEIMEFLFEFLVDGRNLAGKGLSFAEWLQAKTEDEQEIFEEIATHNVDLTNEDQTVQFVEAPKPPQPVKPEQPVVKEATMIPMLPKTGSKNEMIWAIIGLVFVLAGSLIRYDLRKIKD